MYITRLKQDKIVNPWCSQAYNYQTRLLKVNYSGELTFAHKEAY